MHNSSIPAPSAQPLFSYNADYQIGATAQPLALLDDSAEFLNSALCLMERLATDFDGGGSVFRTNDANIHGVLVATQQLVQMGHAAISTALDGLRQARKEPGHE